MAKALKGPVKRRAWNNFSRFIRIRDCLATVGFPFAGVCVTCGKRFHISFLDAGHLFAGRGNAVLFDERVVRAQCRICNQTKGGRHNKFRKIMEELHGEKTVEQWQIESKKMVQDNEMDFDAIAKKYKEKYKELLRSAGFANYDEGRGYL